MRDDEFDPRRILVIDDDTPMLRTHGRVLEAHGFSPVLMPDPIEGLEEARRRVPAVLVTELVMGGMSGLELVSRLRGELGGESPPVVLVTAYFSELSMMEQLLFDAIAPKPYAIDGFITHVRRQARAHYERRRAPSAVLGRGRFRKDEEENG